MYPATIPAIPPTPERRTAESENIESPQIRGIDPPIVEPINRPI